MRALILAADRGSRMGPLTLHQPKCLTVVDGRPLLHWQVAALRRAGLTQFAIVRGYLAGTLNDPAFTAFNNPHWSETNMVRSLACADAWLQADTCLVSCADIVFHPDVVKTLAAAPGDIVIAYDRMWKQLWSERFDDPLSDAETFRTRADGQLVEIGGRAGSFNDIKGQYLGLLKFTPAGWRQAQASFDKLPPAQLDKLDMTGLLKRLLTEGVPISTAPVDGRWCEVDSAEDLHLYEGLLNEPIPWRHDWRWEELAP